MNPSFDEILRRLTQSIVPPRLTNVPDPPIMREFQKATPLSPEEVKALNWPLCNPRPDPRRN